MAFSKFNGKPPYYKLRPGETWFRYVLRIFKNIKAMYPYARIHGMRYYFNTAYRRRISHKRKKLFRKEREGAFWGKGPRKRAKDSLIERDGQICIFCREPFERNDLTIDHIYPLFMGGDSELYNLQLLCRPCHGDKCRMDNQRYLSA